MKARGQFGIAGQVALAAGLLLAVPAGAQSSQGGGQMSPGVQHQISVAEQVARNASTDPLAAGVDPLDEARRMKRLNADRQKHLVSETQKLVALTEALYAEVAREDSDHLTPAQMRKLGEIEKLAKGVREKMTMAVGNGPIFQPPAIFSPSMR